MEPFRIVITGWGAFIQMRAALSSSDRESFIDSLMRARERVLPMERRGILLDLRELALNRDPDERVRAYVNIVQFLGANRVAVVVSSDSELRRIRDALDAAGLHEESRVMIANPESEKPLAPALRWVNDDVDPLPQAELDGSGLR